MATERDGSARKREACSECGFDAREWDTVAAAALDATVEGWRSAFAAHDRRRLTMRPAPEVWSAVEYAVHTAEIVGWWADAIGRISSGEVLTMDEEGYPDADRLPFNEVPPRDALDRLARSAQRLSSLVRDASIRWEAPMLLPTEEEVRMWRRHGVVDASDALLHALHDALHHLDDVRRDLEGATSPRCVPQILDASSTARSNVRARDGETVQSRASHSAPLRSSPP